MPLKLAVCVVVGFLSFAGTALADDLMMPGHLIKSADRTTVYVVGLDFARHVFPDEKTYFTWYKDFSEVHTVSNATLATVPLGSNMTRKPGIRFVKVLSDPKVYFVDEGAVLRWVKTEADARALFGPDWSKLVEDMPDSFFVDYTVGAPVEASPTTGTIPMPSPDITPVSELSLKLSGQPGTVQAGLGDTIATVVTLGSRDTTLAAFDLRAPNDSAAIIKSLRFEGFIDAAEGQTDFQRGYDQDLTNQPSFLSALVPYVKVVNAMTGETLAGPTMLGTDGVLEFSNLSKRLEAGATLKLVLRSDLSSTFDPGTTPDRIAWDLTGFSTTKPDGGALAISGLSSNGGVNPIRAMTVKRFGRAELSWSGGAGDILAGRENLLGTLTAKAVDESYIINKLTFQTRGHAESIESLRLEWTGSDGVKQSVSRSYQSAVILENLAARMNRGATLTFRLYGKLYAKDRAVRDESVVVDFNANVPLEIQSLATGEMINEYSDGDHLKIESRPGDFLVRFTTLATRINSATPTQVARVQEAEVMRFNLTAGADGPVRLRHLTFLIKPSDVETQGADNDLLERWADVVTNGNDADAIAVLRSSADGYVERLARGSTGRISYSIYRHDAKITAFQGVDTIVNDAGLIEFIWTDEQAPVLAAGETITFRLQLDASYFVSGGKNMTIELLGGHDFEWLDTIIGSPAATIDGTNVNGLPLKVSNLYVL